MGRFVGHQTAVGRETEQRKLRQAFDRIQEPGAPAEAWFVHGVSGCGKSFLVEQVINEKRQESMLLVGYGKYDQCTNASVPYEAISLAITDVCRTLGKSAQKADVSTRIRNYLNEKEIHLLVRMVPAVGIFLARQDDENVADEEAPLVDAVIPTKGPTVLDETTAIRFMNIFRRLLLAVSSVQAPLILFLDDLQWADAASRLLLESIMTDTRLRNLLLIGTVRDGERTHFSIDMETPLAVHVIVCHALSESDVTKIVGCAIDRQPSDLDVRSLGSLVYRRCEGNPFFVLQLLEKLERDRLLWYSDETQTYEWDATAIQAQMDTTSNVVDMLVTKISKVSRSSRALLLVFSLIGHSVDEHVIQTALRSQALVESLRPIIDQQGDGIVRDEPIDIIAAIRETKENGLVERDETAKRFKFVHDRVQQAVLQMIEGTPFENNIMSKMGRFLLDISRSSKGKDWMMFMATNMLTKDRGQMGMGETAMLCLECAQKAISQSAFESAAGFADSGCRVLNENGWRAYHELKVELETVAVEANFAGGKLSECKRRIKALKKHSENVKDTFRCFNVSVRMKMLEEFWSPCISECLRGMKQLNVNLPRRPSSLYMIRKFLKVKRKLKGRTPTQLLDDLPPCRDQRVLQLHSLVSDAIVATYWNTEINLLCCLCILSLDLTLKHGMCSWTPFAMTSYASFLTVAGTAEDAFAFGECAVNLAKQTSYSLPGTLSTFHLLSNHLRNPLRSSVAGFKAARDTASQRGDTIIEAVSSKTFGTLSVFCGYSLHDLKRDVDDMWANMKELKRKSFLRLYAPSFQLIHNLTDPSHTEGSISGEYYDDMKIMPLLSSNRGSMDEQTKALLLEAHHARVLMLYTFGTYGAARTDIVNHRGVKEKLGPIVFKLVHAVVCALNELAYAREMGKKSASIGKYMKEIERQNVLGSPDVPAFLALIEAERQSLRTPKDVSKVVHQYRHAVSLLQAGQFYLLEAKALERLGEYLLQIRATAGHATLRQAISKYEAYGALSKVNQLCQLYGTSFSHCRRQRARISVAGAGFHRGGQLFLTGN